jgi:hypothetical protein
VSKKSTPAPRRAEPGAVIRAADAGGTVHVLKADDEGVIQPRDAAEARIADDAGLPVARKTLAAAQDKPAGGGA